MPSSVAAFIYCFLLTLVFSLLPSASTLAAPPSVTAAELQDVRDRLAKLKLLLASEERVRPWNRDGLNTRVDQLGIDRLNRLNELTRAILQVSAPSGRERDAILDLLDETARLALERDQFLEERASRERQLIAKFEQSAQADIARTFMKDLMKLRLEYLAGLATQLAIRRDYSLPLGTVESEIREAVMLDLEQLTGQIRLDAMSLEELATRIEAETTNEDLKESYSLVRIKQSRNIEVLAGLVAVAEALELETAEQRGLLLRERGRVGIELLDRKTFGVLWEEEAQRLRDAVSNNGPNLLLSSTVIVLIVLLSWIAANFVQYPVRALLGGRRLRLSVLLQSVLVAASRVLVVLVGAIIALASIGVSLGPLFAGLGVLSVIIGIGLQDSLGNVAAGVMILAHRPYDVDDHIRVGSAEGLVKRMSLLATTISTFDNQSLIIPNGRIWGDLIVNFTSHHARRIDLRIRLPWFEDVDRVRDILLDVVRGHPNTLKTPEPLVHVEDLAGPFLTMMVKPWVRTEDYWPTYWELNRCIKKRLDTEAISIPLPWQMVNLAAPSANEVVPVGSIHPGEQHPLSVARGADPS